MVSCPLFVSCVGRVHLFRQSSHPLELGVTSRIWSRWLHGCVMCVCSPSFRTTRATRWVPIGSRTGLGEVPCLGWLPGHTAASRSLRSDGQCPQVHTIIHHGDFLDAVTPAYQILVRSNH